MLRFEVVATFTDRDSAADGQRGLAAEGVAGRMVESAAELGRRETRFMGRIVLIIVVWSVFGTALGAGLGVLIAQAFGPDGIDGMIIQGVSWAIFAHLLAGMFAGYYMLADRTRDEPRIPGGDAAVLLVAECASIDETKRVAGLLSELGATKVSAPAERQTTG